LASNLFDKQMVGYNFVSLRSIGDQPGQPTARYLSSWRTLPEGVFIPRQKFARNNQDFYVYTNSPPAVAFTFSGFDWTSQVPFPSLDTPTNKPNQHFISLPYIAFDYMGRLVWDDNSPRQKNAVIPLARGSISFARDPATRVARMNLPTTTETPPGNYTNDAFNLVYVDWLTGHAHAEHKEVK
jgi:hypothetical protein